MMKDQKLWTWHLGAGAVIAVFLGLHMLTMHVDGLIPIRALNVASDHRAVDWVNVVARGKSTFFAVTYVVLLGAALFHGLYGLRNILLELNPAAWLKKTLGVVLLVSGLGLFAFGTWAALAGHALARTF